MKNPFTNLKNAFEVYKRDYQPRIERLENVVFEAKSHFFADKGFQALEKVEKEALEMLQGAFWEDTKEYNGRDNCRLVKLEYLQKIAKG